MSDKPYTIDEVIAMMRRGTNLQGLWPAKTINEILAHWADVIADAVAREVDHALRHGVSHAEAVAAANCRDCVMRDKHPYVDFGSAGVATVHRYEVRETVAGQCNLVATFTDPNRAAEYAQSLSTGQYDTESEVEP